MPARLLLRLFVLLLGSFYLGGVCELDAAERSQNHAHEAHAYLAAESGVEVVAPVAQPDTPAALLRDVVPPCPCPPIMGNSHRVSAWPWAANPPPLGRRLYLRYRVLQV